MSGSGRYGAFVAVVLGILGVVVVWIAIATPLALGLMHPWPVAPPIAAPPVAPRTPDPSRPVAAVLLSQAGTEITDFLAPYAILAASGTFEVYAVAPSLAVAPLNGGLGILPELTLDAFDAAHPRGAAVIVIPNVLDPENPALLAWVQRQSAGGAVVTSICEGARLLAATGLLEGREATTHFAALADLREKHPVVRWRDDRRWVEDGPFVMSAGVTAAIDASLRVVERFAGRDAASRTAADLGLRFTGDPSAPPFAIDGADLATAIANGALLWPKRRVRVALTDGVDEIALAALLDAYPRTFAAHSASVAPGRAPVRSRHGLVLVPAEAESASDRDDAALAPADAAGAAPFDRVLTAIAREFGHRSAVLVAHQLQYLQAQDRNERSGDVASAGMATAIVPFLPGLAALLAAGSSTGLTVRHLWRRRRRRRGEPALQEP